MSSVVFAMLCWLPGISCAGYSHAIVRRGALPLRWNEYFVILRIGVNV